MFCILFGFLIGLAGFLSLAYIGGFVEAEEAEAASLEPQYATGTERLEAYRCKAGETKQIIMGGIEDGFDPAGVETATPTQGILDYVKYSGAPFTRKYDDPQENRFFVDKFEIPSLTFHGIIAMRIEERSKLKNDNLSMGYGRSSALRLIDKIYWTFIADIPKTWNSENNYVWTDLDSLKIVEIKKKNDGANEVVGFSHRSILDAIRSDQERPFSVQIADDTIVDFIGFALCLEPEEHKGNVFKNTHYGGPDSTVYFGDEFVNLYSSGGSYEGDVFCTELRPIPCIDDQNLKAPEAFTEFSNMLWSGGYIKFTDPVAGNSFATEDEVDAFCKAQFGPSFRSVNMKDGSWQGAIVGYGEYPEGHDEYWVHVKDSPHMNCWAQRMDYDDLEYVELE